MYVKFTNVTGRSQAHQNKMQLTYRASLKKFHSYSPARLYLECLHSYFLQMPTDCADFVAFQAKPKILLRVPHRPLDFS